MEVGQTSGWMRPKIAYTTFIHDHVEDGDDVSEVYGTLISWPDGHVMSRVSNSQATSTMAESTGVKASVPLICSYYLTVFYEHFRC